MMDGIRVITAYTKAIHMFSDAGILRVFRAAVRQLRWMTLAAVALQSAWGAAIEVRVLDSNGKPVPEVVVTVSDQRRTATNETRSATMIMDQVSMRFVPELLVVPVGANVAFPNSDTVSHQVYSFSPAKSFQLSLYKGNANPPVTFDKPGLVVLGCNIHDEMVAHIFVTAAPLYGKTDPRGRIAWNDVNAGEATIGIWSPLLAAADASSRQVEIQPNSTQSAPQVIELKLSKALRGSPYPRARRAEWAY